MAIPQPGVSTFVLSPFKSGRYNPGALRILDKLSINKVNWILPYIIYSSVDFN